MIDTFKELIERQFEAALSTVELCIECCPAESWHGPVVNYKFCQATFHVLFFADLYLGQDVPALRQQRFHRENRELFGDYEELEDRPPASLYRKDQLRPYVQHCFGKASDVIAAETAESFAAPSGFQWLPFSRAEVYVYNIRHIQHHAAQLSLRLRIDHDEDVPWVKSGLSLET